MIAVPTIEHGLPIDGNSIAEDQNIFDSGYNVIPQFRADIHGRIDLFDPDGPLDGGRKAKELQRTTPSPGDLAELINDYLRFEMVQVSDDSDSASLMWWDGRLYRPDVEKLVGSCVQTIMGRKTKKDAIGETIAFLERMKHLTPLHIEKSKVCLLNGVLDLVTFELLPFRGDLVFTTMLPVYFDPQAEAYEIGSFLREVLDDESGKGPEGKLLDFHAMTEFLGHCLERGNKYQKGIILVGSGANGKSVWTQVMTALLGPNNVSSVSMEDLGGGSRFCTADLVGKMANICADISDKAIRDPSTLKKALGGDSIMAERKYGQPFSFKNEAKMIFSCNSIPECDDLSNGWTRRWMIFNFPRQFGESDADPNLIDKLTTPQELSGLLNLAIEGLKRLREQGHFTGHDDMAKDRERYMVASDPSSAFLMRRCYSQFQEAFEDGIKMPIPQITSGELYGEYVDWCRENRLVPASQKKFGGKVQEVYPGVSCLRRWTAPKSKGGKNSTTYLGIGLVPRQA